MEKEQYYNKEYFGLKQSFGSMLDFKMVLNYIKSPVLDIGCGQGKDVDTLRKLGFKTDGCDIFNNVLKLGNGFYFHDFENKPNTKLYNTIVCVHVLEHIFDYINFLKNIRKSLTKNGKFILALPNAYSLTYRVKYLIGDERVTMEVGEPNTLEKNRLEPHIRFFGKKTLRKVLEKNGFEVLKIYATNSNSKKVFLGSQLVAVCRVFY